MMPSERGRWMAVDWGERRIGLALGFASCLTLGLAITLAGAKAAPAPERVEYRVLATNKTSTMQKEMQEAGDAGYEFKGQTIFDSTFGGKEVVVVLERDKSVAQPVRYEYRLLATKKTSTLQKEVSEATAAGYAFVGMTVADTVIGGDEIVSILRKRIQ